VNDAAIEEHVGALVALLPPDRIAQLALGPFTGDDDEECRFCTVFDDWKFCGTPGRWIGKPGTTQRMVQSPAQRRRGRAFALLHDWHQGWQLYEAKAIANPGQGPECYRRCLLIYRAAGWPS